MLPKVLIVEHSAVSPEASCLGFLGPKACYERNTWDKFVPETLLNSPAQLIVLHAVQETEKAVSLFDWLQKNGTRVPLLVILPELSGQELVHAASQVADDFVISPFRKEELNARIARLLGPEAEPHERIWNQLRSEMALAQLVGKHASFLKAVEQAPLFGGSDAPVLITGETGTGKELFAHAIHSLSARRTGPFIPLDCGTLPEHLAENELFGHRRGAFTDAHTEQKGLAAMAEGGTLFLDEIDALSLASQSKLLRFLQERSYRSLGSDRFVHADVRVIAATNACIEECVRKRQFRSDLYFRINVLRLQMPSLRERKGDVSLLARHFLENECAARKPERKLFSTAALRKLESYPWPGNVRELFNAVQRAFLCCPGRQILPDHLSLANGVIEQESKDSATEGFRGAKQQAIEDFERAYAEELLVRHRGNVTRAAREAGKERRAFGRLVKKYGLGSRA